MEQILNRLINETSLLDLILLIGYYVLYRIYVMERSDRQEACRNLIAVSIKALDTTDKMSQMVKELGKEN